jgi:cytochrome c
MKTSGFASLLIAGALALAGQSALAQDAAKGEKLYKKCKACHSLEAGKKKVGPSLAGIFGRTAGTTEGFKFSKAMKESGIVWDDKSMDAYLANPKKFVPKTRMAFPGLKKEADRANLLAYLKEAAK